MESIGLDRVVSTAAAVAATGSRKQKSELIAAVLEDSSPSDIPVVVGLLTGEPRQGRIGVGWSTVRGVDVEPSSLSQLTVADVNRLFDELAAVQGAGSKKKREALLVGTLRRATEDEAGFIRAVLTGGLRQGALEGVMVDAIGKATGVPIKLVRRAAMLSGDLGEVASIAAEAGRDGLEAVGLRVLRGVLPMLAASSESAGAAVAELGPSAVQAKLDGIRVQAHRSGPDVRLFTRNLNDVTERLPGLVELLHSFDVESIVLDGEVIGVSEDPDELFQDTASTFSSGGSGGRVELGVQFFDILHRDGVDLIDEPLEARLRHLEDVAGPHLIEGIITDDPAEADRFADDAISAGHEGVMVKAVDSPYAAGRRGKTWRKVKPVHTFDLVVLGAEWGHGRRTGWLSNLHLGARDDDGEIVMVGKTFKGLTDALLAWQTNALLEREVRREGITVFVRPELVVEIALDGVQRSTTYPGGLALRFARVKKYRPDKSVSEANTLDDLRELFR